MVQVSVLCGGSGSSKFALAITRGLEANQNHDYEVKFISNVADNFWHNGLYVCPDVDIITHALSGKLDESKGWGIASDTFIVRDALAVLNPESSWFNLGDRDLALSMRRTELLSKGKKLSEITEEFCKILGIRHRIIPATDDHVETRIRTSIGWLHLQEFWVKYRASMQPLEVKYEGIDSARPNSGLISLGAYTIICPANPITSILPIVNLHSVKDWLGRSKAIAISPFVGRKPFSGPAGLLMEALRLETSSFGVANLYSDFLKVIIVDNSEEKQIINKIKDAGIECISKKTRLASVEDQMSFWKDLSEIL